MAWAAITEPMIFEDAQQYASEFELACVSCVAYGERISEFNVRPVVSRYATQYDVYNYFEDGSYRKTSATENVRSYSVYFYVPSKVRYNNLLTFLHKHLYPHKGRFPSLMLWQTADGDRFVYSCTMGVFHAPMYAPFTNPLFYFETSTIPTSKWEKKVLADLEKSKKDDREIKPGERAL